ncbi:DUF2799 domain-containing protein [Chthonobacter rhizosphaerae]|uniref:DUF2799 domain-containing protein n=1 Tax=Chthonobacter rhizosphaerae TaxID=2735553 RepID=UPI0015EFDA8A|nr:DUF2799 domain-containing protein [Chthonobacter rhizosphaerae]
MASVSVRRLFPAGLLAACAMLLAACGTLSKSECQTGDWYTIGLVDGQAGADGSRLQEHAKSCARYSLPVDPVRYEEGRAEGLRSYCTPPSGFANGMSGAVYRNVCTGRAGSDFLAAYGLGTDVYRARSIARDAAAEARAVRGERDRLDDRVDELRSRMANATPEERERLRDRIEDIRFDMMGTFTDQFAAQRRADAAARDAAAAEAAARAAYFQLFGTPAP